MHVVKLYSGMVLLESLVAMLLLTAGVLGLSLMHQQTLLLQRQQLVRDNAMRVADNMAQRMLVLSTPAHARDWGEFASPSLPTCENTTCSDSQWILALKQQANQDLQVLPMGDMAITPLPNLPNAWAITVAWQDAEESFHTGNTLGTPNCPVGKSCWRLVFRTH